MKLTPLDIHHKEFRRAIRGYSEEEVDVFLDQVAEEFERVFKENIDLKEQMEGMRDKVKQYEGLEQTLQKALFTAQQAADGVESSAKKEADLIIKDAELKAKEIIQNILTDKQNLQSELGSLKGAEKEFREKFKHLLNQYLDVISKVEKSERAEEPVEPAVAQAPAVEEVAPGLNLAPEPEPEPIPAFEPEPVFEPEQEAQQSPEPPMQEEDDKPQAESASAADGFAVDVPAPPIDPGPGGQFSASAPDVGYGGPADFETQAPAVESGPVIAGPETEPPRTTDNDFKVSFDQPPAVDAVAPAVETVSNDPAPAAEGGISPTTEAPLFSLEQDVPEFNPMRQAKPDGPVEVASSVSSFFDDDLGIDEEEKKDDWSAPRAPRDGETGSDEINSGNS